MSLYHKHRPTSLKAMHGNKAALHSLANELAKPIDAMNHYFLLILLPLHLMLSDFLPTLPSV